MERRQFFKSGLIAAGAATVSGLGSVGALAAAPKRTNAKKFNMKFSPEFGIFSGVAGKDPIDQVKWGHDQGFNAWENTMLKGRPVQEQESISNTLQ